MLKNLLRKREAAIVKRWLDYAVATYAPEARTSFSRERDPFANPVGHSLRVGTQGVFQCLLDGVGPDEICRHLEGMIKIRAIQDFSPSEAVSFVFLLKKAVREELGATADEPRHAAELAELDADVDQIALFAFDIYTRCRERVYKLRVEEVKRRVSATMDRLNRRDPDPALTQACSATESMCSGGKR